MKQFKVLSNSLMIGTLVMLPLAASAHEHQTFTIGDKIYEFGIGSLNEPVAVDDKSGVELSVTLTEPEGGTDHDDAVEHEGTPVTGLEQTLKVEVIAGDKKKTLDLSPVYGEAGSYKAVFIPTVQTTFTYRVFGTINNTAVNLSFACNPAGHAKAADWTGSEKISDGVTKIATKGAFGCPGAKEDLGFPEPSSTIVSLSKGSGGWGGAGAGLGALGFVFGLVALARTKKRS